MSKDEHDVTNFDDAVAHRFAVIVKRSNVQPWQFCRGGALFTEVDQVGTKDVGNGELAVSFGVSQAV